MRPRHSISIWTVAALIITFFIAPIGNTTALPSTSFEQGMQLSLRQWYAENSNSQWQNSPLTIQQVNGSGAISGTVISGGNPVEKAHIFCWAIISDGVITQSAVSDDKGNYKLDQLDAGDYYVIAAAEGYHTQFYRNGRTPMDAEMVTVVDGQTVAGIDFNLKKSNGGTGAISGQVTDQKTGAAVPGTWIVAVGRKNPFQQENQFAVSDAQGNYKIGKLANDIYVVAAYANGYLPELYDDAANMMSVTPVIVVGSEVTGINFKLAKGGSISGVVKSSAGQAISGAKIHVEAVDKNNMDFPGMDVLRQMMFTDAEGNYKVAGLAAGNYRVSASVSVGGFWVVKYFNDKDDRNNADQVLVVEGLETTGINFQFAQPTGKISGRVTDSVGNPLAGILITFVFKDDSTFSNWGRLWHNAETNQNGDYELTNLKAGTYYIGAWIKDFKHLKGVWYDNAVEFKDAAPIALTEGQAVADINFKLNIASDYGSISGVVLSEKDDSPVPYALIQAVPKNGNKWGNSGKNLSALLTFSDQNGAYKLHPLYNGDYHVVVRKNGYVEYFNDKTAETADAVTVIADKDTPNINFKIPETPATGSIISGNVIDEESGAPIAGAMVSVFPAKRPRWFVGPVGKWTRVYYASFTDADGNYKIGGIPEGAYLVSAWARGYIGELFNDTRNMRKATTIQLSGSDKAEDIDFVLKASYHQREQFGGIIAGVIQGNDGGGVDQAMVFALNSSDEIVTSAVTAPDGSYTLTDLESGDYRVMVNRPSFEAVYYPNAADPESAQPVAVNSADQSSAANINVTLSAEILTAADNAETAGAPQAYILSQNYPNPFNPVTMIEYRLPEKAAVSLQIFNVQGRLVTTLVSKEQNSGVHQAVWNGLDQTGAAVPSGAYFYQLQANDFTEIKSLMLLK